MQNNPGAPARERRVVLGKSIVRKPISIKIQDRSSLWSFLMKVISYTDLQANLVKFMDHTCETHEPILITRSDGESVVVLSLSEYESMKETLYLLGNHENATRLWESIQQIESGQVVERELIQ
jgi:antitoxin YefM